MPVFCEEALKLRPWTARPAAPPPARRRSSAAVGYGSPMDTYPGSLKHPYLDVMVGPGPPPRVEMLEWPSWSMPPSG